MTPYCKRLRLMYLMGYEPRGTRTVDHAILGLARSAAATGWRVTFVFTAHPPEAFRDALAATGAEYAVFSYPLTWRGARKLARTFRGTEPHLLLTSYLSPFHLPILWLKLSRFARRLVVIDHASGSGSSPGLLGRLLRRVRGWLVGRIVDRFIAVSGFVAHRQRERAYLPAAKVQVIPNGVDCKQYTATLRPVDAIVQVAFAGQLIPEKGLKTLLEAYRRVLSERPDGLALTIAGQGPQREELERYCRDHALDRVRFLGHTDEIPALFGRADVVVVPSEWGEAFGLVAIEAMASGAAVLTSDAGGLPEVVGDAGVVFRAGDVADLAAKLQALVVSRSERERLGTLARARAEEQYSLSRMIDGRLAMCDRVFHGLLAQPECPH